MRQPLLALLAKEPTHGYELTSAGRDTLAAWVQEPTEGPQARDEFFMKPVHAPMADLDWLEHCQEEFE